MSSPQVIREGYAEQGVVIATACDLKEWSLRKLCRETGIPTSRMDRIVKGARISHDDGLKIEEVLGLSKGKLSPEYRRWARKRKVA